MPSMWLELLDDLLKDYQKPEDLLDQDGYFGNNSLKHLLRARETGLDLIAFVVSSLSSLNLTR